MIKDQPILIADDNSDDILLLKLALGKCGGACRPIAVAAGDEAIQYLKGEGRFADRAQFPLPILILLDLHMPRVDGFEVLTWLRAQPDLRHLPVVVLAGSSYLEDMQRAYELGANSFVAKPADLGEFTQALKAVLEFWTGPGQVAAQLPLGPPHSSPGQAKQVSG